MRAEEENVPVHVKAVLIDPGPMTVVWMNEAAWQDAGAPEREAATGLTVEKVVPMAEALGLPDAMRAVADTGKPHHVLAELVSSARGTVALVTSIYRLPDGQLLLLTEHAFKAGRREPDVRRTGPSRRRRG